MTFASIEHKECELQQSHRAIRERSLVKALAEALKIIENEIDLSLSLAIVEQVVEDVAPLSGEPLVLVCGGIDIIPEVQFHHRAGRLESHLVPSDCEALGCDQGGAQ